MNVQEFDDLLPDFERELTWHVARKPNRQRKPGGGQKGHLKTAEDKLFFILFYLKTYPTFDVMGFFSNKSRGRSCEAAHLYLMLLEQALGKKIVLPQRKIHSVEEFLEKFPEVKDIFVDGTERRIQRPKKAKRNKRQYSGKKKSHTRKNIIVADEKKRILVVSPTKPGRRHDKNLTDRMQLAEHVPDDVGMWGDSGFQGLQDKHPNVLVAKRPRKNRPLTVEEKRENQIISTFRIVAEHAIGGMKRYRVMTDTLRNKLGVFDDRIAVVTAGIWNYHLASS
ncbi:MAG: transposase family protein [Candidatus Binatia bacterium]